jgi:hypothetical protein
MISMKGLQHFLRKENLNGKEDSISITGLDKQYSILKLRLNTDPVDHRNNPDLHGIYLAEPLNYANI